MKLLSNVHFTGRRHNCAGFAGFLPNDGTGGPMDPSGLTYGTNMH